MPEPRQPSRAIRRDTETRPSAAPITAPVAPITGWIEYFRDLGIHEFYRRGEVAAPLTLASAPGAPSSTEPAAPPDTAPPARAIAQSVPPPTAAAAPAPFRTPGPAQSYPPPRQQPGHSAAAAPPAQLAAPPEISQPVPPLLSFDKLAPLPATTVPIPERAAALAAIQTEIGDCTRCPLAYAGRRKIVFADGSPAARLMFIGEGPGADEDVQGLPFVGKAGQLLNNMIAAMGLERAEVYIANIVKCRPPANRVPEPVEANTCSQFLVRQIDIVRPEVIVALGSTAATYLLGVRQSLASLRARWHTCRGTKLVVTYHPAFLLRDPRMKSEAWKDLQMVMAELGLQPPPRKPSA